MDMDPVSTYQQTFASLDEAKTNCEAVVQVIADAAAKLKRWPQVQIENANGGVPTGGAKAVIDGSAWPSAQELAETLGTWHKALRAVRAAWQAMPLERQKDLIPPP